MAIGRISGQMLKANLLRSGTDLAFETNLLVLDVTNSFVGIGTATPARKLHISDTGALRLPSGTDAQRGTAANGDIRYNTDQAQIEGYVDGAWVDLGSGSKITDADGNTGIDVERSADANEIHFFTESAGDVAHIRADGSIELNNLEIDNQTITGLTTNADITITPNGTGSVKLNGTGVVIAGNLTVNGTTTTVESTTLQIEDPLLVLAKNNSGGSGNTYDQGLLINRGGTSTDNKAFIWDESATQFAFISTTETGNTAGNVTVSAYADLRAATGTFANVDGILGANSAAAATVTSLNASGDVALNGGSFVFNDSGADKDFRIEGDTDANLIFVDASTDRIGISNATPAYILDIDSTDAVRLPLGNDATRPSAATGVIRFNTDSSAYEGSTDGSTWTTFAMGGGGVAAISKVSATGDGSTSTFNGFFASAPATAANVMVFIDNVYQEPTENYTVSSNNISFTSAPHSGARIFALVGFDAGSMTTGGVARTQTDSVSFTSSATALMTFNANSYRSAELFIQVTDSGNTEYSCMKANVIHDGTTAYISVYGIVNTGTSDSVTLTATYTAGTVYVYAVSTGGASSATVQYSLSAV